MFVQLSSKDLCTEYKNWHKSAQLEFKVSLQSWTRIQHGLHTTTSPLPVYTILKVGAILCCCHQLQCLANWAAKICAQSIKCWNCTVKKTTEIKKSAYLVETIIKKLKAKANKGSSHRATDVYDAGYINSVLKEMKIVTTWWRVRCRMKNEICCENESVRTRRICVGFVIDRDFVNLLCSLFFSAKSCTIYRIVVQDTAGRIKWELGCQR